MTSKNEESSTKEEPKGWPPVSDIFYPTWALVIVTGLAVYFALKTLRAIRDQVKEMQETGKQTDKLIAENITQSTSMQKSVGEAARLASAMEIVAKEIAVSSKAATDSVTALRERTAQQMRAYLAVSIGGGTYQERDKGYKFEGKPFLVNTGHTPAHNVRFKAKAAILPVPVPQDFGFPIPDGEFIGGSMLGSQQNAIMSGMVNDFVDDAEVNKIKVNNENGLYVWGIVTYEDIFGESNHTNFCQNLSWLLDGKIFGVFIAGHNDAS